MHLFIFSFIYNSSLAVTLQKEFFSSEFPMSEVAIQMKEKRLQLSTNVGKLKSFRIGNKIMKISKVNKRNALIQLWRIIEVNYSSHKIAKKIRAISRDNLLGIKLKRNFLKYKLSLREDSLEQNLFEPSLQCILKIIILTLI